MDLTLVIQILLGLIMTGGGFWVRTLREDIKHLQNQVQRTREEYVHKNDMRELKVEMSHRFDKLEELIRDKKE